MKTVINAYHKKINFDEAVGLMNEGIYDMVRKLKPSCDNQTFFDIYCEWHYRVFEETFIMDRKEALQ